MVTVRVRVVDDHFKPVDNPSLDLSVQTPRGEKVSLRAAPSGVAGVYEVRYRLPVEGGYRFAVSAAGAGGNLGSDMALLSAADFQKEISSPGLDETYLRDLAAASGGEYLTYAEGRDFDERLARALNPRGESTRILSEERIGVGNLPLTFAFLLVTLALDWTVRKRYRVE